MTSPSASLSGATFIYPPDVREQRPDSVFNYRDTINVSWQGPKNDGIVTQLLLWAINRTDNTYFVLGPIQNVSETGWTLYQMNIGNSYPLQGHFDLSYNYTNGTPMASASSNNILVKREQNLNPVTWSAGAAAPTTTEARGTPGSSASESSTALSGGAIGGLVLGVILGLLLLMAIGFLLIRRYKKKKGAETPQAQASLAEMTSEHTTQTMAKRSNPTQLEALALVEAPQAERRPMELET